jgi:hypothetical protein
MIRFACGFIVGALWATGHLDPVIRHVLTMLGG